MGTRRDDKQVIWFSELTSEDTGRVGGKNASLGEMLGRLAGAGIRVPDGFATTAAAYWEFLEANQLDDLIVEQIDRLHGGAALSEVGQRIRRGFLAAELSPSLREAVTRAYEELARRLGRDDPDVAVRSSATAEDLPQASFAGQQETFLNVTGPDELLAACQRCLASLFTDRAISYREDQGFDHRSVALSVGVQQMVRSDLAGAGVLFTIDTESGFPDTVLINAAWGLGEVVVGGMVDPDEYVVFKPMLDKPDLTPLIHKRSGHKQQQLVYGSGGDEQATRLVDTDPERRHRYVLTDSEILTLARWGTAIE